MIRQPSNSKKTQDVFDVQRDHVELLTLAMRLLKPNGICYFSTNFRRFELDNEAMEYLHCQEISHETLGFDFKRNHKNSSLLAGQSCLNNNGCYMGQNCRQ